MFFGLLELSMTSCACACETNSIKTLINAILNLDNPNDSKDVFCKLDWDLEDYPEWASKRKEVKQQIKTRLKGSNTSLDDNPYSFADAEEVEIEEAKIEDYTLSSQDQELLEEILAYVEKGNWQHPATAENVSCFLRTLFGAEIARIDHEDIEKTKMFRDFFRRGRGRNGERVEVSMANIIGYLMKHDLLCGGPQQISEEFFGNYYQVNNINKGKNGEGNMTFRNIIPLMDKYRRRVIGK